MALLETGADQPSGPSFDLLPSSTLIGLILWVAVTGWPEARLMAQREATNGERFVVTGRELDQEGKAIENSVIIPLAASGSPLEPNHCQPATVEQLVESSEESVYFTTTDSEGRFELKLPAGQYRLVAQSWPEVRSRPVDESWQLLGDNGNHLRIDGSIEIDIANQMEAAESRIIRPLGEATVLLRSQESSDALVISAGDLVGDGGLGLMAATTEFWTEILGLTAMDQRVIRISGLPPSDVSFLSFVNDNHGGFGAVSTSVQDGQERRLFLPVIANWSNGHKTPPAGLEELVEYLLNHPEDVKLLEQSTTEVIRRYSVPGPDSPIDQWIDLQQELATHLDETVELTNGQSVTLRQAWPALTYYRLNR